MLLALALSCLALTLALTPALAPLALALALALSCLALALALALLRSPSLFGVLGTQIKAHCMWHVTACTHVLSCMQLSTSAAVQILQYIYN